MQAFLVSFFTIYVCVKQFIQFVALAIKTRILY